MATTKKTTKSTDNPAAIGQPRELKKVDELKSRLLGTDREDHWGEVLNMEQEIKRELLKQDLSKHRGMQLLLDWMIERVRDANALLTLSKSKDLTDSQRDGIIEMRDFVTALIRFMDPKGARLAELDKELDFQLEEPDEDGEGGDIGSDE